MLLFLKKGMLRVGVPVIVLIILWFSFIFYRMAQVERSAVPQSADVAIVLGAAVRGDQPSPALAERLEKAYELYQQKYIKSIIVSGGIGKGKEHSEADVMKGYLIKKGVPASSIYLEKRAVNTLENLSFSQQIMQEHGYHTALIVSHNYHLMRAMEMANILAMDAHPVGTDSVNIFIPYYRVKEGFAYTKWTYHKLFVLPTQESEGK
ncbi:YdcF family protein [Brevibacillus laterosporus]|uniref:YdcF family protein n=1 Tax=Brevibacillus laterosporus TaxID=1465 RepID=A0AAP3DJV6_BRELA|nr:YdcF family protein [Brevibacillus laterosporus]MCR8981852.1 YdcF family protein [Brevibacillus laterosporus]MCZ0809007.1 YdcF family protein [Brevibacillus laterosporus]MCZ0827434.1 YdcF family protein [Brevibacillus laterosporus]MCZ0851433.1 YdcF family protein [Brevibacillus laterosporus]MED1666468.1 YdcF family protein [Brevibacillus laterosporus]